VPIEGETQEFDISRLSRSHTIYFGWVFDQRACLGYIVNILNRFITLSIMSIISNWWVSYIPLRHQPTKVILQTARRGESLILSVSQRSRFLNTRGTTLSPGLSSLD